jgi:hypothetical protein
MPFVKKSVNSSEWTLLADSANTASFQNIGQRGLFINVSADANTAPEDDYGIMYPTFGRETSVDISSLFSSGGTSIWGKAVSGSTSVIVFEESNE